MSNILKTLAAGSASETTDEDFNQTVLLLHGDGTNGAQNNTFLDSSTNTFTITRNGNTTQGTFSPFSLPNGEWSNFFDGSGDNLSIADNTALTLTADFTIECWIYPTAGGLNRLIISKWGTAEYYIFIQANNVIGFAWGPYSASGLFGGALLLSGSNAFELNEWSHVAVVRNSNTFTLYVNGTSIDTETNSAAVVDDSSPLTIGDYGGGGYAFAGYVSNARIVKGTAVYTTAFTPPTAPLTAIANTSLLTCQTNRFKDNSTNNFAVTVNGNTSVQPFSPFLPSAAYDPSVNGGSGYFDGSGDYLVTPSNAALSDTLLASDFTIETWLYLMAAPNGGAAIWTNSISNSDGFSSSYIYNNLSIGTGKVGVNEFASSANVLTLNTWNHFACVRNGATVYIYVNGTQVASGAAATYLNTTATKPMTFGSSYQTSPEAITGYFSNIRVVSSAVYTSTFTPPTAPFEESDEANTELLCNFTNAGIFDNTGKNNLETVADAQIDTSVKKYGTGSMEFDGTGDYLQNFSSLTAMGSGDFTWECWVYFNSFGILGIIDSRLSAGTVTGAGLLYVNGSNQLIYWSNGTARVTSSALSTGQWYHFAVVRNSGTVALYIDGSSVGTAADTTNMTYPILRVGATYDNYYLNGYIDDLRITKGVARYTAAFTPPTQAFFDL